MARNKILSVSFFLLLFVFSAASVGALTITARYILDFEPRLQRDIQICVGNSLPEARKVTLSKEGDLAQYTQIDLSPFTIAPGGNRCLVYALSLPDHLDRPGFNSLSITATDSPLDDAPHGQFIIRQSVAHELRVAVPYPGRYLDATLGAQNINVGENEPFEISVSSKGSETIPRIDGIIEVRDLASNRTIATLPTEPILDLAPASAQSVQVVWDTSGRSPGPYAATARISYDNVVLEREASFFIGSLDVSIHNVTTRLVPGRINRVDIIVESEWSTRLEGIYAELAIPSKHILEKTPSDTLLFHQPTTLSIYIDAKDFEEGELNGSVTLHYSGTQKTLPLVFVVASENASAESVQEIPSEGFRLGAGVIVPIAAVIILILLMILLQQRRRQR